MTRLVLLLLLLLAGCLKTPAQYSYFDLPFQDSCRFGITSNNFLDYHGFSSLSIGYIHPDTNRFFAQASFAHTGTLSDFSLLSGYAFSPFENALVLSGLFVRKIQLQQGVQFGASFYGYFPLHDFTFFGTHHLNLMGYTSSDPGFYQTPNNLGTAYQYKQGFFILRTSLSSQGTGLLIGYQRAFLKRIALEFLANRSSVFISISWSASRAKFILNRYDQHPHSNSTRIGAFIR